MGLMLWLDRMNLTTIYSRVIQSMQVDVEGMASSPRAQPLVCIGATPLPAVIVDGSNGSR
jgi:hypothetical protein